MGKTRKKFMPPIKRNDLDGILRIGQFCVSKFQLFVYRTPEFTIEAYTKAELNELADVDDGFMDRMLRKGVISDVGLEVGKKCYNLVYDYGILEHHMDINLAVEDARAIVGEIYAKEK